MNKIEIFLPLPGMTAAMDKYFTDLNVVYFSGLPTGPELRSTELTEEELLAIGLTVAQDKLDKLTRFTNDDYTVSPDCPFITEFTDSNQNHIGWEFEFQVNDTYY